MPKLVLNSRGAQSLPRPGNVPIATGGTPIMALQRLNLSDFTQTDAGSRLSGAVTDGGEGSGWSIPLTGGLAAITDPFDAVYWIGSIRTIFGASFETTSRMWTMQFQLIERTSPGLSTDYNISLGVCNESTNSATIDALLAGMRYGANRTSLGTSVTNGAASTQAQSASAMRGLVFTMMKKGLSSTSRVNMTGQNAVDAALANVDALVGAAGLSVASFGEGSPYIVVAAWRSATTAGDVTGAFDLYAGVGTTYKMAT